MISKMKLIWPVALVVCLVGTISPALADQIFMHPLENNGTENISLAKGISTFTADANPNGYHWVEWYNTSSGGKGLNQPELNIENRLFRLFFS